MYVMCINPQLSYMEKVEVVFYFNQVILFTLVEVIWVFLLLLFRAKGVSLVFKPSRGLVLSKAVVFGLWQFVAPF